MTAALDRCELCGARIDGRAPNRIRHLRARHPAYAMGVLLRVVAPGLFLIEIAVLSALQAAPWTYVVALSSALVLLVFGKVRSRAERQRAGARPALPMGRLLREGGLAFTLVIPIFAIIVAALGR